MGNPKLFIMKKCFITKLSNNVNSQTSVKVFLYFSCGDIIFQGLGFILRRR